MCKIFSLIFLLSYCYFNPLHCLKIACAGDFISTGYPYGENKSWFKLIEQDFQKKNIHHDFFINVKYEDAPQYSYSAPEYLRMLLDTDKKPDIYIIALGLQDALSHNPYQYIYKDFEEAIRICRIEKIPVLLGVVDVEHCFPALEKSNQEYLTNFKRIYERLKRHNPEIILFPLVNDDLMNSRLVSLGDGLHPNEAGQVMLKNLVQLPLVHQMKLIMKKRK